MNKRVILSGVVFLIALVAGGFVVYTKSSRPVKLASVQSAPSSNNADMTLHCSATSQCGSLPVDPPTPTDTIVAPPSTPAPSTVASNPVVKGNKSAEYAEIVRCEDLTRSDDITTDNGYMTSMSITIKAVNDALIRYQQDTPFDSVGYKAYVKQLHDQGDANLTDLYNQNIRVVTSAGCTPNVNKPVLWTP